MLSNLDKKVILVTGAAGFIGFHISKLFLTEGWRVIGLDCLTDYYDISLKKNREALLLDNANYVSIHERLEEPSILLKLFKRERPEVVIHLAAQAGVRHSIENPRTFLESNIIGTFELLEAARAYPPQHMLLASTSSAYGGNVAMPYKESDKSDHQMSFYAATKKSTENMAHSYSHLFSLPITMFRFFTVYGPWGRPDMALFKFTHAMLNGKKIDVYNNGDMYRDFTYIDDLIMGMRSLVDVVPFVDKNVKKLDYLNGESPVAPFRLVNIGNSKTEKLTDLIGSLEKSLGVKASKNFMPMQAGDMKSTWADTKLLKELTNYQPKTSISVGISKFVTWYRQYYNV